MKGKFLIITGMSGAGKSLVLRTLEDLDYLCIDNLPDAFVGKFAELSLENVDRNVAIVVDIRGGRSFDELLNLFGSLQSKDIYSEMLFMDAADDVLVRRYKETRRRHPLADLGGTLLSNIKMERELLEPLRRRSSTVIDTSLLDVGRLKESIALRYGETVNDHILSIKVQSFGFKYGLPMDSDIVFDVRFLSNPFYVAELRALTGKDEKVIEYMERSQRTAEYLCLQNQLLDYLVPKYLQEGKLQLMISVGCTGGRHRSVYVANKLTEHFCENGFRAEAIHRDVDR